MKVYLAGKIGLNDWRHAIVPELGDISHYNLEPDDWPILVGGIDGIHDYVGPYFSSSGHGQGHDCLNAHGCGNCRAARPEIAAACLRAIRECDLMFAYIETRDCFGTLFEIGYASAIRKQIVICYAPQVDSGDDMWFQNLAAVDAISDVTDPEETLRAILPQPAPRNNNGQMCWQTMPDGSEKRQAYYCSLEWDSLRQAVIARANGYCERCRRAPIYAVHHLTYARLYKEQLGDLQGLCETCHQQLHQSRIRNGAC